MRIQSAHSMADRGRDLYESPECAVRSLIAIENLPKRIWEPAAGKGAIVRQLETAGHSVVSTDVYDYGCGFGQADYLTAPVKDVDGIVTNPPYFLAEKFISKAIREVPYSAWLLRTNFMESVRRLPMFRQTPPSRIWVSSRRLPMMHRDGWDGPVAGSNTCYCWMVFEQGATETIVKWFDWREHDTELRTS